MKRTLCLICIGSLALTLTAWGQPTKQAKPGRANAHPTANVRATRPANNAAMRGAHHYTATAPSRQRTYTAARSHPNKVVNHDTRMRASGQRNVSSNRDFRARNNAAVNRERNVAVNQARNAEVNRDRNAAAFRARNNLAGNGGRNFAYYRGRNVAINNNFHSAAFRGQQYAAFRDYNRQWHDRSWWRSHYDRIVFVNGGWYCWNAGYWFPAWGYAASAYYAFDGPIYGYNGLAPDRVIVDVQSQLQRDGYYDGPIDGALGPMTREAIAAFQSDNGLAVTSVIDQPTLATLGIA
jgi:hypothetical protein